MQAIPQMQVAPAREWYCYMQRPLSEHAWYIRLVVRWLHRRGWSASDGSRRAICIAPDEETAQGIINHYRGGKAMPLPKAYSVDEALPEEVGNFGQCLHADPEAQKYYLRRRFKNVNINSDLLNETRELAGQFKRQRA